MNSARLKWILIALFLAVNLFFLHEYLTYSDAIATYTDEEIEAVDAILKERGIIIPKKVIPKEKTSPAVIKLAFPSDYYEKSANALMIDDFAGYALPDGVGFSNEHETLVFIDQRTFSYSASNADQITDLHRIKLLSEPVSDKAARLVKSLTKELFPSSVTAPTPFSLAPVSSYSEGDSLFIRISQTLNGTPIDGGDSYAVFDKDTLVRLEGKLFFSCSVAEYDSDAMDAVNVLFEYEKGTSPILAVTRSYYPVQADGSYYLTPSYRFVHENGEVHLRDATSGKERY